MEFTAEEVQEIVRTHFNLSVVARRLGGYDEENFLLETGMATRYVLKITTGNATKEVVEAGINMLEYLNRTDLSGKFQQVLKNKNSDTLTEIKTADTTFFLRIYTFLEGTFWHESAIRSPQLFNSLGRFLGRMDRELRHFDDPRLHRSSVWDVSRAGDAIDKLSDIPDAKKRRLVNYFLLQFDTEVRPRLSGIRHACIHGDVNDYNVLVSGSDISGLIDFGDAVFTALINNLAIACTYAVLTSSDPLRDAAMIVRSYHHEYPLMEEEIDILYYLISARLCISVTQSAHSAIYSGDNQHRFVSEKNAWRLLEKWIRISPLKATHTFRRVCGFDGIIREDDDYPDILKDRRTYIGRNLSIAYKTPVKIVKGALQYLYDDKGKTYLDCVNNVSHVGHCHPVVVRAMQQQIAVLNTNTRYLNDLMIDYAKVLTATLPASLKVCYFVNSGSEANDLAIRMARNFTERNDIIVLDHAYHGTTTVDMEMSPYKFDSQGGSGQKPYIHKALFPDLYRGKYTYADTDAAEKYADSVLRILEYLKERNTLPAAFICETLSGVGGQWPLAKGYLKRVYEYVRGYGGVCIADEVQVGFGRVGEKFWGFGLSGVVPDIVVMGKPMGNGHPLAAVVVTGDIADAFNNGLEYFNTYGGNPVSMAAGLAVMDVIRDEKLQENALDTGASLLAGLMALKKKHPMIGDVRGKGLFIGIELVKNLKTKDPAVPEIDEIIEKMKDRGFLLSTDGPLHNVIKIKPPVIFDKTNAQDLVKNLDEVMGTITQRG